MSKSVAIKGVVDYIIELFAAIKKSNNDLFLNEEEVLNVLRKYVNILIRWGGVHNVISSNYVENDIWENIFDSICSFEFLKQMVVSDDVKSDDIIDAGAGGGFPGIPLSIIFSSKQFVMVDSSRKKCSFLRLVKSELKLSNMTVMNKRLEHIEPARLIITKAAFSPPHSGVLANVTKPGGKIIIWSTANDMDEFVNVLKKYGVILSGQHDYVLPSNKDRRLLVFSKI